MKLKCVCVVFFNGVKVSGVKIIISPAWYDLALFYYKRCEDSLDDNVL